MVPSYTHTLRALCLLRRRHTLSSTMQGSMEQEEAAKDTTTTTTTEAELEDPGSLEAEKRAFFHKKPKGGIEVLVNFAGIKKLSIARTFQPRAARNFATAAL